MRRTSFLQAFCPGPRPMDELWDSRDVEAKGVASSPSPTKQPSGIIPALQQPTKSELTCERSQVHQVEPQLQLGTASPAAAAASGPTTLPAFSTPSASTAASPHRPRAAPFSALPSVIVVKTTTTLSYSPPPPVPGAATVAATAAAISPQTAGIEAQLARVLDQRHAIGSSLAAATQRLDAASSEMQRIIATADLLGLCLDPPASSSASAAAAAAAVGGGRTHSLLTSSSGSAGCHLLDMPAAPLPSFGGRHAHSGLLAPPLVLPAGAQLWHEGAPAGTAPQPPPLLPHASPSHQCQLPAAFMPAAAAPPLHVQAQVAPAQHLQMLPVQLRGAGLPDSSWVDFDAPPLPPPAPSAASSQALPSPAYASAEALPVAAPSPMRTDAPADAAAAAASPSPPAVAAAAVSPATEPAAAAAVAASAAAVAGLGNLQQEMAQTRGYIQTLEAQLQELHGQETSLRDELVTTAAMGEELLRDNGKLARELEAHEMIYASTIGETSSLHQDLQTTRAELNATRATVSQKDDLIEILQAQLAELLDSQQQQAPDLEEEEERQHH